MLTKRSFFYGDMVIQCPKALLPIPKGFSKPDNNNIINEELILSKIRQNNFMLIIFRAQLIILMLLFWRMIWLII